MKIERIRACILTPALFAGILAAQAERPQLTIKLEPNDCKLRFDVTADLPDWICGVMVSVVDRRIPLFADVAPILGEGHLLSVGRSKDGRFRMDAEIPADLPDYLFFQAIVLDERGWDATATLRIPTTRKPDADLDPDDDRKDHDADADMDADGLADDQNDADAGGELAALRMRLPVDDDPCATATQPARLALEFLSTDGIPPWHSMQATYKAPGSGYHLGVQRIDRQKDVKDGHIEVSVYLLLTGEATADKDFERLVKDAADGPELLYAGAELGFGIGRVKVYFAATEGKEPVEYDLVRCVRLEE